MRSEANPMTQKGNVVLYLDRDLISPINAKNKRELHLKYIGVIRNGSCKNY
jgi:hypothetical protein